MENTFTCVVCGKTYEVSLEYYPLLSEPACVCNVCAQAIRKIAGASMNKVNALYAIELLRIRQEMDEFDLTVEQKNFVNRIINAYFSLSPTKKDELICEIIDFVCLGNQDECCEKYDVINIRDDAFEMINQSIFSEEEQQELRDFTIGFTLDTDELREFNDLIDEIVALSNKLCQDESFYEESDEVDEDDEVDENDEGELDFAIKHLKDFKNSSKENALNILQKVSIPRDIEEVLKTVKCQDSQVYDVARLMHRHVMRCRYNAEHQDSPIELKDNFFILGPTGVGKTLTIRKLCQVIKIPCVIADMTAITKAGYVGAKFEESITQLIEKAGGNIKLAEMGIIVLDEGDKNINNARKSSDDPGGESVMFEMLKKAEGSEVSLGGGKFFNTKNVLFICVGTFEGAFKAREKRIKGGKCGFSSTDSPVRSNVEQDFTLEDFLEMGAIREYIGRFPNIVEYKPITEEGYHSIIWDSNESAFLQSKKLFEYSYGIELILEPAGEKKIIAQAMAAKLGARGIAKAINKMVRALETEAMRGQLTCKKIIISDDIRYE